MLTVTDIFAGAGGSSTGAADGDMTEDAARRLLNGSLSQAMTDHRTYMRAPRSELRERMPLRCPHQAGLKEGES